MCRSDLHTRADRWESKREKKCMLEKTYDRVNREALWRVLRMRNVGSKLLSGIKSMYIDISACVRVKGAESERFRVDSVVRRDISCLLGCSMYIWMD